MSTPTIRATERLSCDPEPLPPEGRLVLCYLHQPYSARAWYCYVRDALAPSAGSIAWGDGASPEEARAAALRSLASLVRSGAAALDALGGEPC